MGRVPGTTAKKHRKHLTPRDYEFCLLYATGKGIGQIAAQCGVHRATVSRAVHSPLGRQEVDRLMKRLEEAMIANTLFPLMALVRGS